MNSAKAGASERIARDHNAISRTRDNQTNANATSNQIGVSTGRVKVDFRKEKP